MNITLSTGLLPHATLHLHKCISGVIGAVGGTHILILGPSQNPDAYINRKGLPSFQLEIVVAIIDYGLELRLRIRVSH